jgi:hypothetical protein
MLSGMIDIVPLSPVLLMSKGFAPPHPPQSVRPTTLEALALSQRLKDCFASIQDPRVERTRLHQLSDILTIAILAVMAGGNGWEDMEVYGLSKQVAALCPGFSKSRGQAQRVINVSDFAQWYSQCGYLSASVRADESETI